MSNFSSLFRPNRSFWMTGRSKSVQTTTSWTPELAQVHVIGPTSPLPPKQRSKCRCCKESLSYFSIIVFGGVQGNVPKFGKLWRIRFQSNHFGWNNSAVNFCYWIDLFWTIVIYEWTMICGFKVFWKFAFCMKFSPSINNGWGCFLCKQHLLKTRFWRVAKFDVKMTKMVLSFPWQFGMSLCCLRMCMLENNLQNFFNLVLFQQLCGRELCGDGFCVFTACCMFFFWPAPFAFRRVTTWGLFADQRGIEPPPAVCPRRQERRPTNWATRTPSLHAEHSNREVPTPSPKIILVAGAKKDLQNPLVLDCQLEIACFQSMQSTPHQVSPPRLGSATF